MIKIDVHDGVLMINHDNGFYYIGRHDDESIWIGTECGEGMQISNDKFYQLISDFYAKEF